jgi:hypothetical protein
VQIHNRDNPKPSLCSRALSPGASDRGHAKQCGHRRIFEDSG